MFCAISICCAASRATWSFARDKAIPLHTVWARVHRPLGDVPVYANALTLAIQLLLGLIFLGSSAAFNAFVGVAVICLGASYAMPVAASLANGRRDMQDAPFNLGRWGVPLNAFAVLWVAFSIVLFSMPAVIPVTKVTMSECYRMNPWHEVINLWRRCADYASVVFVGFGVLSGVWYLISEFILAR